VDAFITQQRKQIADLAIAGGLPSIGGIREYVEVGGLMSYGANLADVFRQAAVYVAKILNGSKPAELPVQQPTLLELWLNEDTARVLHVAIPQSVRLRADRVLS
jgi:putative ABC transport system substrate-binding protein